MTDNGFSMAGAERSSALQLAILALVMPTSKRHFAPGPLQFLTSSTYRRAKLFESDRFRWSFVEVLRQLRIEMGFLLIGGVLARLRRRISVVIEGAKKQTLVGPNGVRPAGGERRSPLQSSGIRMTVGAIGMTVGYGTTKKPCQRTEKGPASAARPGRLRFLFSRDSSRRVTLRLRATCSYFFFGDGGAGGACFGGDAGPVALAAPRPRRFAVSGLAASFLSVRGLQREETTGEAELHAR